uniref:Cht3_0 protein n=1 Tax=Fopius arisanus TaxID=64838 RepID=A0A0C9QXF2_9HYME
MGDDDLFKTFHPSRLMGLSDLLNTDNLVDLIHGLGVDKGKILISVPASGYKFTLQDSKNNALGAPTVDEKPVIIDRKEFCEIIKNGEWIIEREGDLTAPYIFNGLTWIAFEDEISTKIKGKYVLLRDIAGLAIHDVANDSTTNCSKSILEEIYHSFTDNQRKTREAVLNSLETDIKNTASPYPNSVKSSNFRIVQVVDSGGNVRAVRENKQTEFICMKQGHFVHPKSCNRFYRCVKFNQQVENYSVFEFDCPDGLSFDERTEVCVWPGSMPKGSPCPGSSEIAPTAPRRFRCPGEGYYADPNNCRWFFACMNLGQDDMTPYEFRCPYGLVFDEKKLVCDWPWLVPACAGKNYNYGGENIYGTLDFGVSNSVKHGENNGPSNNSAREYSNRYDHSSHGHEKNYTKKIHSSLNHVTEAADNSKGNSNPSQPRDKENPQIKKNYTTTLKPTQNNEATIAPEGGLISTIPSQDNIFPSTPKYRDYSVDGGKLTEISVNIGSPNAQEISSKPDEATSSESSIQTSNSVGIISSINRPIYVPTQSEKPGFGISINSNADYDLLQDNPKNREINLGKGIGLTGSDVSGVTSRISIGNAYHPNQASTIGIKTQSKYYPGVSNTFGSIQSTKQYNTNSAGEIQFPYTPAINRGITNNQFGQNKQPGIAFGNTGGSQTSFLNEIHSGVTPALPSGKLGFHYSTNPYVTSSEITTFGTQNAILNGVTREKLPDDYSVAIPKGSHGNQFFTNYASKDPINGGNPFLPSTPAAPFKGSNRNELSVNYPISNSGYKGNPFLPSTPSTPGDRVNSNEFFVNQPSINSGYKGNPFLPPTPAPNYEGGVGTPIFTYPSRNPLYKGNPFLPPTSATGSGNKYYPNQAGNSAEVTLRPSSGNSYKTNEYYDNGGRSTIRYNNGLITHKYTEDDIKSGKIPYQTLSPWIPGNQTSSPIAGIYTAPDFIKTVPAKTGITKAQLGGSGTYVVGSYKPTPITESNTIQIGENAFSSLNNILQSTVQAKSIPNSPILKNSQSYIKRIESTTLAYDKKGEITTQTPIYNIQIDNKPGITSRPVDINTFSKVSEISPTAPSTPLSVSSTAESIVDTTRKLSSDGYKFKSSTSIPDAGLFSQPFTRPTSSSSVGKNLRDNQIDNQDDKNDKFSSISSTDFKNDQGNYGQSTQTVDEGYDYEDRSTSFGQKISQNKIESNDLNTQFDTSTKSRFENSASTTLSAPADTYDATPTRITPIDVNYNYPRPNSLPPTGEQTIKPILVQQTKETTKESPKPGNNYNRGTSKYRPTHDQYDDTEINKNNPIKVTTQQPAVTTYNGGYKDSSAIPSSGIVKIEKGGKVVVKYSDLHPVLLEKLEAECTCRSDPFALHKSNKPLLIDSSKGIIDLANYDESDIDVDLGTNKGYSENIGLTTTSSSEKFTSNVKISRKRTLTLDGNIDTSKSRDGKNLSHFENYRDDNQNNETFDTDEIEFLGVDPEGKEECARAGLFRHPKFCNKFYVCHWDQAEEKFILNLSDCPVHLSFDSRAGACNWPSDGPACQSDHLLV